MTTRTPGKAGLLVCLFGYMVTTALGQTLSIVSGDNQTLTVGQNSSTPLVVTLCQKGQLASCGGLAATPIEFLVQNDEPWGSVCDSTFTSCSYASYVDIRPLGTSATVYLSAGQQAGSYTVTATDTLNNSSVTFHVINLAGPPWSLKACCGQNFQAVEGQQFPSINFTVLDQWGNPANTPNISVTLMVPSTEPSGNFAGSRTATIETAKGFGTVPAFTGDNTAGSYKLHASAGCFACTLDFTMTNVAPTITPVSVTVATNPSGLMFTADGQSYQAPHAFSWSPGSVHTLSASSPQTTASGTWTFSSWSSNVTNGSLTVGSSAETVTATFTQTAPVQYMLSATASPTSQGSLSVSPPASDGSYSNGTYAGHYNAGTVVQITATPDPGYVFLKFEGGISSTSNPVSVTMSSAIDTTAIFAPAIPTTIATNPPGLAISVDGLQYTAPQTFQWTQASQHTIGASSSQVGASGAREAFSNWSDGGTISHTITVGAAAATYTANFTRSVSPLTFSCGAAGSPQVGTSYSLTCTTSGGLSPYKFTVSAGTLPPGLNLTSSGAAATVGGSPTAPGTYNFTLNAADNSTPALTATQSISLTVAASSSVLSVSPAAGLMFTAYQGRSNPSPQNLSLASTEGTTFTVTNWPSWVQVSPSGGATPAILSVTANPTLLPLGLTSGSIAMTPANAQPLSVNVQINVTVFSIGAAGPINEAVAAGATKNDSLAVTTVDNGPASVQAAATTTSGGNWLKLAAATLSAPGALAYTIDATALSAGNYTGAITLSCAAANPCSPVPVTVNLTVTQSVPTVAITQVLNATGEAALISQNTWIEIKGTNLSQTTRTWQSSDFDPTTGLLPTQLDGVSATVNGKSAYVYYISPTQVNVLTPLDSALGTVDVQLENSLGTSAMATALMLPDSLGFFAFNSGKYAAATHVDGSLLGPTSLYPGQTTPAKAGETIVLYGNGFGQTNPPITAGLAVQQGVLPDNPTVTIGGIAANVIYAAVVSPGLYQFNVVVPAIAPPGDLPLLATYNGVSTQPGVIITVSQ